MKCSLGTSNFLEEISSLFHSVVFPLFLCIDCWGRLSYLFLLFFGTLHSDAYMFPFLLCFSLLFFFTAICKASPDSHLANTLFQQHKRSLYTWTSPDGQQQNQIDYILCSQRWGSSIQSAKIRLGIDCGSDHELLIAKFRLKLQRWGKPLDHSGIPKSNPLWLYSRSEK